MQLTRTADYATRVMIHLTGVPSGTRVNRETLARWTEVPAEFLGKVLQSLARARLINSHRGSLGGFELARDAATINMLEIVEAIEGPIRLNVCVGTGDACNRRWWCPAHEVWKDAQAAMVKVLGNAWLDKLSEQAKQNLQNTRVVQINPGAAQWS